jgi:hypothetical protein
VWGTETPADRGALEELSVYRSLRAVQNGNLVFTDGVLAGAIYFTSLLSLPYVLDELVPLLERAVTGDPSTLCRPADRRRPAGGRGSGHGGSRRIGGLKDDLRRGLGLRHHRGVGGRHLHDGGAGALGHEPLQRRRDRLVLAAEQVPAGGPAFQAGGPDGASNAAPLHGRCVAAMTSEVARSTSAAKAAWNASRSR